MVSLLGGIGALVLTSSQKARLEEVSVLSSDIQNSLFFPSNRLGSCYPSFRETGDTKNLLVFSKLIKKDFLFCPE